MTIHWDIFFISAYNIASRAIALAKGLLGGFNMTYTHVQELEQILERHGIPFVRLQIDSDALFYDIGLDMEDLTRMEGSAAQIHDIQGELKIYDKDITAIFYYDILGHVLCHSCRHQDQHERQHQ